jgi:lipopolysaccharide/colanic/teichoic acid biosynthesis glycosyltransferase
VVSSERLHEDFRDFDEAGFGRHLLDSIAAQCPGHMVTKPLGVRTFDELLDSQRRVLAKEFDGLMLGGREVEERVWLSRNVSLHPTARIIPPVFIGENSRIGQGVQLGPNAAIGKNCVLDTRCTVADSKVFQGSFVGEALELSEVMVDKNRLVNVRFGVAVSVTDDFILGSMADRQFGKWFSSIVSRLVAALLLIVTWPVLLLTALFLKVFRKGPVLNKTEVVELPADIDEIGWRTFGRWSFSANANGSAGFRSLFLDFLPALVNVARGEMRFVGVRPRTRQEIQALPHDWRALYLKAKSGIVSEALVHYGLMPADDDLYSAEAFYSVAAGFGHDLKLLFGYAARMLSDSFVGAELRHSKQE